MRKRYIQKQGVIHTHNIIEIIRVVLNAIITSNIHTYEKKYLHTSQIGNQMTKTIMQYMYKNTWKTSYFENICKNKHQKPACQQKGVATKKLELGQVFKYKLLSFDEKGVHSGYKRVQISIGHKMIT